MDSMQRQIDELNLEVHRQKEEIDALKLEVKSQKEEPDEIIAVSRDTNEDQIDNDVVVERTESNRESFTNRECDCNGDRRHDWYVVCDRKQYLNRDGRERKQMIYACYNCEKWGDNPYRANSIALGLSLDDL